jgi:hypothetical protein
MDPTTTACVFSSMNHGPNDHCLLVLSLQLHLKALKHEANMNHGPNDHCLLVLSLQLHLKALKHEASMNHGPNDHCLLVLSLQLHLKALKHEALARQRLDGALLWEPGYRATFGREVGNHFAVLPSRVSNPEKEWGHFVMAMFVAITKMVGMQGSVQ